VLNGIFWVLRSAAPWRDLPDCYGPYTTCYNRFNRWGKASIWDQILETIATASDVAVQMIDTSVIRVHQHRSCIKKGDQSCTRRSRGGLTTKIYAVVDANGLPIRLALSPGQDHDSLLATGLLDGLGSNRMLLADRGYDSDAIREFVAALTFDIAPRTKKIATAIKRIALSFSVRMSSPTFRFLPCDVQDASVYVFPKTSNPGNKRLTN